MQVVRDLVEQEGAVHDHSLAVDAVDVDQLVVLAIGELLFGVVNQRKSAGHARAEVVAGVAEYDHFAAGHVFTAMVARALDHC